MLEGDPRGRAGHLHDIAAEGFPGHQGAEQARGPLTPEHRDLGGGTILHDIDKGDDGLVREIDVANDVARLIEHLLEGQVHEVEMGFKRRKVLGLQRSQQPVPPMICFHSFAMAAASLHPDNADGDGLSLSVC